MRYQFIKEQQASFSLSALCRVMQVCRSGYYAWQQRRPGAREQANTRLLEQVQRVYEQSDKTYGSPRITIQLQAEGVLCNEKRIARLMRQANLKAVCPKRFMVTTDSAHDLPVADNLLAREFDCPTPNTRWTTDITYLWTGQGWLYLAVVLDLFSRRVVGWAMDTTLERSLLLSALWMALRGRAPQIGLLCHSDRGSQYASADYQKALQDAGAVCSMSRRGNCWDNAVTESFFSSLKRELVHGYRFETRDQTRTAVFRWIEVWYNRLRRHSALGYLSPEAFERQYHQQQAKAA